MNQNKLKIILVSLLIVAVIIGIIFLLRSKNFETSSPGNTQIPKIVITDLVGASLPEGLIATLPVESGSRIIQNYNASSQDGRTQGTRSFTTKKSPAEALKFYESFFTKQNWKSVKTEQQDTFAASILRRNEAMLTLIAKKDAPSSETIMELTLVQPQQKEQQ